MISSNYYQINSDYMRAAENYHKKLDNLYDRIIKGENCSSETKTLVIKIIDEQMKNILDVSISSKAHNLFKLVFPSSKEKHSSFRKFIRFLILLDNKDVYDAIETHYVSESNLGPFTIVLEEFIAAGKETTSLIDAFIYLIDKKTEKIESVEKVLSIINKDLSFVVSKLIEARNFNGLNYLTQIVFKDEQNKEFGIQFASIVKDNKKIFDRFPDNTYTLAAAYLMALNQNSFNVLLDDETDLEIRKFIINNNDIFTYSIPLIKNYSIFSDEKNFLSFEKEFIEKNDNSYFLLNYAKSVERSDKRLVLNKLLGLSRKNSLTETYLIEFLKHFPQYKNLLLMI
jgi:hypothetical protein